MVGRSHFDASVIRLPGLLFVLTVTWICAGCMVVQAAAGKKAAVDVTKIQPGLTRTEAEVVLGAPIREWKSPSGVTYRTYQYDSGRPPNFSEAAAGVFVDVFTLGLIEFAVMVEGTSLLSNAMTRVVVSYDDQDVILGIFDEFDELPSDGRSGPQPWKR
jgi:hypothetical protein